MTRDVQMLKQRRSGGGGGGGGGADLDDLMRRNQELEDDLEKVRSDLETKTADFQSLQAELLGLFKKNHYHSTLTIYWLIILN